MESPMFTLAGMRPIPQLDHASLTLTLDHLAKIPTADYIRELPSFGFPSLRAQVIHIFNCEAFWSTLSRISPSKTKTLPATRPSPKPANSSAKSASEP